MKDKWTVSLDIDRHDFCLNAMIPFEEKDRLTTDDWQVSHEEEPWYAVLSKSFDTQEEALAELVKQHRNGIDLKLIGVNWG